MDLQAAIDKFIVVEGKLFYRENMKRAAKTRLDGQCRSRSRVAFSVQYGFIPPDGYWVYHRDSDTENFDMDNLCLLGPSARRVLDWWSKIQRGEYPTIRHRAGRVSIHVMDSRSRRARKYFNDEEEAKAWMRDHWQARYDAEVAPDYASVD